MAKREAMEVIIILPKELGRTGIEPVHAKQIIHLMKWFQKHVSPEIKKVRFRKGDL